MRRSSAQPAARRVWTQTRRLLQVTILAGGCLSIASAQSIEQRIDGLLQKMTLDEKLGKMSQSTSLATPLSVEIKEQIRAGRWGSFLNAGNAADRAEAQRIATKESRLGIPLIFGRDVIHGYHTVFPIPLRFFCATSSASTPASPC